MRKLIFSAALAAFVIPFGSAFAQTAADNAKPAFDAELANTVVRTTTACVAMCW
ncbi:MAG: hypothetical protein IPO38_05185 [Rhodocyclaceae bacterium]|nr:hypothetical protein [Rhodocyclaceae bacterium]